MLRTIRSPWIKSISQGWVSSHSARPTILRVTFLRRFIAVLHISVPVNGSTGLVTTGRNHNWSPLQLGAVTTERQYHWALLQLGAVTTGRHYN